MLCLYGICQDIEGTTDLPGVDENDHPDPTQKTKRLSASARRDEAVRLAQEFATKDWSWWTGTGFYTPPMENGRPKVDSGTPEKPLAPDHLCWDCARFMSYVLWRAGFKMVGPIDPKNPDLFNYKRLYDGWWANWADNNKAESKPWFNADGFYTWWRAHGAVEVPEDKFGTLLQKGDIIAYNNRLDNGKLHVTHVVMAVGFEGTDPKSRIPHVAGRGTCFPDNPGTGNPTDSPYDSLTNVGKIRTGLHMPYEQPQWWLWNLPAGWMFK